MISHPKYKIITAALTLFIVLFFLVSPVGAQGYTIDFWADRTQIYAGECLNIHWNTDNVQSVYYNGQGVSGINQTRLECPAQDTVYNLVVNTRDGRQLNRQVYVDVSSPPANWENWNDNVLINFWADRTQIRAGECLNIYWNTSNVETVFYNGHGVSGVNQSRWECPGQDTTYDLIVNTRDGQQIHQQIYVDVIGRSFDEGELEVNSGKIVDLDDEGHVSSSADDFRWRWSGGEEGHVAKVDDDDDLRLARVGEGSHNSFNSLSLDECRDRLDDDDEDEIKVDENEIACFRTDDGVYGKFWVENIRSTDGKLEADWYIWR